MKCVDGFEGIISHIKSGFLLIDQQAGTLRGIGPGWISSVRYTPKGLGSVNPRVAASKQLSNIRVGFQKAMEGDLTLREITVS